MCPGAAAWPTWAPTSTPNTTDGKELVQMLVERGADPNQQMFFRPPREPGAGVHQLARHHAVPSRLRLAATTQLIKYLLAHGADMQPASAADGEIAHDGGRGRLAAARRTIIATLRVLQAAGARCERRAAG